MAVLDLLSISGPIPKKKFIAFIHQIQRDPLGPYGDILLQSIHFVQTVAYQNNRNSKCTSAARLNQSEIRRSEVPRRFEYKSLKASLEKVAGTSAAQHYKTLLESLGTANIFIKNAALLIIDPQHAFTEGAWMQSIGYEGKKDVTPIRVAFDNCALILSRYYGRMEIMFTRCPFPAESYGWARQFQDILNPDQLYFIKPGNSVLFPTTNGFRQWVDHSVVRGLKTLVVAGCTLNSCVRVSAIDTAREFQSSELQVVVDLNLCGARMKNYLASPIFNGLSAVASAVAQMLDAEVKVVSGIDWLEAK